MTGAAALVLETVSIRYGKVAAVENLSLAVPGGELFGLLGPNGSGKSTTLSAIAGVLEPAQGTIRINGRTRRDNPDRYAAHVGLVPQEVALYEELTVRQNLAFFGNLYGLHGRLLTRKIDEALARVCLKDRADARVQVLSGGMQRRLNLACSLLHDPDVLLLDEPTVALDPNSRDALFATLSELRSEGRTILLTTHHLDEAEQWCDRVGVIRQGRLLVVGSPAEVLRELHSSAVIFGNLRQALPEYREHHVRAHLGSDIELEVIGRRVKLSAPDGERLGQAIAALHAEGVELESFRTPPARLERLACIHESTRDDCLQSTL